MVVAHRAIGHDLGRLGSALADVAADGVAPGSTGPVPAICRYAASLLAEVRAHVTDQDEIVWPVIAAAAGQAVDLDPLTDDHVAILATADRASKALGSVGELAASLSDLREMLDEHMADEERQIFPVMRRYVRAEVFRCCEIRASRAVPLAALRFRMPWLARHSRAGEMTRVLAGAGSRARLALVAGRPGYGRLERLAFGSAACQRDNGLPA